MNDNNNQEKSEQSFEDFKLEIRKSLVDLIHHPNASAETKQKLSEAVELLIKG